MNDQQAIDTVWDSLQFGSIPGYTNEAMSHIHAKMKRCAELESAIADGRLVWRDTYLPQR